MLNDEKKKSIIKSGLKKQPKLTRVNLLNPRYGSWDRDKFIKSNNFFFDTQLPIDLILKVEIE